MTYPISPRQPVVELGLAHSLPASPLPGSGPAASALLDSASLHPAVLTEQAACPAFEAAGRSG